MAVRLTRTVSFHMLYWFCDDVPKITASNISSICIAFRVEQKPLKELDKNRLQFRILSQSGALE